jgi:hypothetical protein
MSIIINGSTIISGSTSIGLGYKINTEGLSLYLDARNSYSYPGSGNIWFDLSSGANNVTTGSMTYVNAGLTSSFSSSYAPTGSNTPSTSFIDFYAPNLTTVATIETLCRFNNYNWPTQQSSIFQWNNNAYRVGFFSNTGQIFFTDGSGISFYSVLPNSGSSINGSSPIFGIWYYFVFEMYDGNIVNNKMWINGVQQTLISSSTGFIPANQNFNGGNGSIAKGNYITNVNGINNYSIFKVYNRTLSQEEITYNYNNYKSIFNLY